MRNSIKKPVFINPQPGPEVNNYRHREAINASRKPNDYEAIEKIKHAEPVPVGELPDGTQFTRSEGGSIVYTRLSAGSMSVFCRMGNNRNAQPMVFDKKIFVYPK
ncbi:hypothetical protein Barb7_00407 [Bacteroidales bacterium Barb7]|nr:hypothetical protein Barb7_00407 [Bacteroidales bacterium Barb7]